MGPCQHGHAAPGLPSCLRHPVRSSQNRRHWPGAYRKCEGKGHQQHSPALCRRRESLGVYHPQIARGHCCEGQYSCRWRCSPIQIHLHTVSGCWIAPGPSRGRVSSTRTMVYGILKPARERGFLLQDTEDTVCVLVHGSPDNGSFALRRADGKTGPDSCVDHTPTRDGRSSGTIRRHRHMASPGDLGVTHTECRPLENRFNTWLHQESACAGFSMYNSMELMRGGPQAVGGRRMGPRLCVSVFLCGIYCVMYVVWLKDTLSARARYHDTLIQASASMLPVTGRPMQRNVEALNFFHLDSLGRRQSRKCISSRHNGKVVFQVETGCYTEERKRERRHAPWAR